VITDRQRKQLVRIYLALVLGLVAGLFAVAEYAMDSGLFKVLAAYPGLGVIASVALVYLGLMFGLVARILHTETQKMLLFGMIGVSSFLSGSAGVIRAVTSTSVQLRLHWVFVVLQIVSAATLIAACALGLATGGSARRKAQT
jgi:hypothetical protein